MRSVITYDSHCYFVSENISGSLLYQYNKGQRSMVRDPNFYLTKGSDIRHRIAIKLKSNISPKHKILCLRSPVHQFTTATMAIITPDPRKGTALVLIEGKEYSILSQPESDSAVVSLERKALGGSLDLRQLVFDNAIVGGAYGKPEMAKLRCKSITLESTSLSSVINLYPLSTVSLSLQTPLL